MLENNPGGFWAREVARTAKRGPTPEEVAREVGRDLGRVKKIADKKARGK